MRFRPLLLGLHHIHVAESAREYNSTGVHRHMLWYGLGRQVIAQKMSILSIFVLLGRMAICIRDTHDMGRARARIAHRCHHDSWNNIKLLLSLFGA